MTTFMSLNIQIDTLRNAFIYTDAPINQILHVSVDTGMSRRVTHEHLT